MLVSFHVVEKPSGPVEYVRVEIDPTQIVDRPATDEDRGRWPEVYAAFKAPPLHAAAPAKEELPWIAQDPPLGPAVKPEKPKGLGKIWKPKKSDE